MIVSLVSRQFTRQALRASRFYGTETSSAVYPVEKGRLRQLEDIDEKHSRIANEYCVFFDQRVLRHQIV
jgi:hypothetical protein